MEMFKNISQKRIYLQILEQIMDKIRRKELRAGDRLPPERQWSEELGVSRASVREAIRALEMIGLVQCRQGEGNFISENFHSSLTQPLSVTFWLRDGELTEIHEFRQMLEIECAKLAAQHATEAQSAELQRHYEHMMNTYDKEERASMDSRLHAMIAAASGNCLLEETLISASGLFENLITGLRAAIIRKEKNASIVDYQHGQIVRAIVNHDPIRAGAYMTEHMLYVEDFLSGVNQT